MENVSAPKPICATLVLAGCISVLAAHAATSYTSGDNLLSTPVSALSQSSDGNLHGLGLSLFAMAQIGLAFLLNSPSARWPTRAAQALLALNAALLIQLAWHFAEASGSSVQQPRLGDPLFLLANATGVAMALATPGLLSRRRRAGRWNLACFAVWLALAMMAFVVDVSWIGAYERLVGAVFVVWSAGLAILIGFGASSATGRAR